MGGTLGRSVSQAKGIFGTNRLLMNKEGNISLLVVRVMRLVKSPGMDKDALFNSIFCKEASRGRQYDVDYGQSGGASIVGSLLGYPMLAMMSAVAAMLC
jgi:hypothetical protein